MGFAAILAGPMSFRKKRKKRNAGLALGFPGVLDVMSQERVRERNYEQNLGAEATILVHVLSSSRPMAKAKLAFNFVIGFVRRTTVRRVLGKPVALRARPGLSMLRIAGPTFSVFGPILALCRELPNAQDDHERCPSWLCLF